MLPVAQPTCGPHRRLPRLYRVPCRRRARPPQDVLADLIGAVVTALRPTFRLAKLEGDSTVARKAHHRARRSRISSLRPILACSRLRNSASARRDRMWALIACRIPSLIDTSSMEAIASSVSAPGPRSPEARRRSGIDVAAQTAGGGLPTPIALMRQRPRGCTGVSRLMGV